MQRFRLLPVCLGVLAAGSVALASVSGAIPEVAPIPTPQPAAADVNGALNLHASTVLELDVNPALVGMAIQVDVPIEGEVHRLDLWPHSVRGEGFRLIEHLADGTEREVDPGPVNTLRGEIIGMPGSAIAGGMMPEGLYLKVVFADGRDFWLEPLVGRVHGAGKNHYVLYRGRDAISGGFCGTTNDQVRDGDGEGLVPAPYDPRGLTTWTAQMGTDADVEYYTRWGGTTNVNSRIAIVTNTMNLQYERDVDIRHVITTARVRTAEPDPYSTSDPATLNAQIVTAWAGESFTNVDVIQLFTHRTITGSTIGRANAIGSICNNQNSSCWSRSDFNNNFSSATDLSAHELGHLWNGIHCTCSTPASTMNPSITSINRFGVNTNDNSISRITSYRNSRTCLTTSASTTPPPNDLCANAVRVFTGTYGFNNIGALTDGPAACGLFGADIWYFYIAPCNGTLTVETCTETGYDTVLAAYTGGCGSLTEVACNDDTSGCGSGSPARQSRITFAVTAGTTYRIRVGGFNGLTGNGILSVIQATCPTPVNNTCGNATLISSNTDVAFSTFGATTTGPLESSCLFFGDSTVSNDIWFRWVAQCTESVTVTLCGSLFDTKLAAYTVCPTGANQAIACNDDACGLQSSLSFSATAGTTYRFRVGGYNGAVGTGTIRVNACAPPANDNCGSAIDVSAGGTFNGTLVHATNDGTATCGSSGTQPDVWYRFTAPASHCPGGSRLVVTTCGTHDAGGPNTGMDTVLALFSSCGGTQLDCNDDTNRCGALDVSPLRDSRVTADLSPGQTVLIRVSRFSTTAAGPFILRVSYEPANNDCVDAPLIGLGTVPFCTLGATTDGPAEVGLCNQNNDVWFRFTATCSAPFRVSTCGANYDSEIAIYNAPCPATAPAIACNDDSCGLQSQVTFSANGGSQYLIRVGGFSSASRGSGNLTIRIAADWNGDGVVNSNDISAYLSAWLNSVQNFNRFADFNNDNLVNSNDISAFLSAWLAAVNNC